MTCETLNKRQRAALLALYEHGAQHGTNEVSIYGLSEACPQNRRAERAVTHPLSGDGSRHSATFASLGRRGYVTSRFVIEARCKWWQLTEKGLETAQAVVGQAGGPTHHDGPRLRPSALAEWFTRSRASEVAAA